MAPNFHSYCRGWDYRVLTAFEAFGVLRLSVLRLAGCGGRQGISLRAQLLALADHYLVH